MVKSIMEYGAIFLLAIALGMDAFAICIVDGLVYPRMNMNQKIKTVITFGVFQSAMPVIGYFLGLTFYDYIKEYIKWISFGIFIILGVQMLFEGIKQVVKKEIDNKEIKEYKYSKILIQGVIVSLDELAVGITLLNLANNQTIFICASIFLIVCLVLSSVGIFLGKQINRLFKNKYGIADIVGGVIFLIIAISTII